MTTNKEQDTNQRWEMSEREFRKIFIGSGFYISPKRVLGIDCLTISKNQMICAVTLPIILSVNLNDLLKIISNMAKR